MRVGGTVVTLALGVMLGAAGHSAIGAAVAQQGAGRVNPDSQYRLGPDSLPQEGVPKGEIKGPFVIPSQAYPGTQHTYWVYVPAQYDPKVPASLMIYQDGQAFKNEKGDMRAQNVMDNLIYRREIPVMSVSSSTRAADRISRSPPRRLVGGTDSRIAAQSTTPLMTSMLV